jgi:tRNA (guanine-N7-)-methyltransferase
MVSSGMRKYRQRSDAQAQLVGSSGEDILDPATLFGRRAPLRLEIGFGHGRFLSNMAASHPDVDFIGVERNDLRVTKTAHKSNQLSASNVRLFHDEAHHFVRFRLPPACLQRVYILFSDPWPKFSHRRRRLVNRSFLVDLSYAAAPGCQFVFASDTHEYAFQVLSHLTTLPGIWANRYQPSGYRFDIPTRFPTVFESHKKAEGHSIAYLMFERTQIPAPEQAAWRGSGNS